MSNVTIDTIFARRSVRAYTDKKLDDATVDLLAKIALSAPSANNAQPVNVIVVRNAALIREMELAIAAYFEKKGETAVVERIKSRGNKIFYDAPVSYFLAVKNNSSVDVGIMAENISIAAGSLGLGSILLGLPNVVFNDPETCAYWKSKVNHKKDKGEKKGNGGKVVGHPFGEKNHRDHGYHTDDHRDDKNRFRPHPVHEEFYQHTYQQNTEASEHRIEGDHTVALEKNIPAIDDHKSPGHP
ncbi:hypothetical protein AGMMS49928_28560 [Spirochaetia bacterium]|nr:hypothetical protein AGMMS49928_28560 [Spirochaetia bacterium]